MSRRFRVSRQADADLDEIALNIGADNPSAAIDVLDKLHETFLLLAEHPEIGTLREDLVPRIRMFARPSRLQATSFSIIRCQMA